MKTLWLEVENFDVSPKIRFKPFENCFDQKDNVSTVCMWLLHTSTLQSLFNKF